MLDVREKLVEDASLCDLQSDDRSVGFDEERVKYESSIELQGWKVFNPFSGQCLGRFCLEEAARSTSKG